MRTITKGVDYFPSRIPVSEYRCNALTKVGIRYYLDFDCPYYIFYSEADKKRARQALKNCGLL